MKEVDDIHFRQAVKPYHVLETELLWYKTLAEGRQKESWRLRDALSKVDSMLDNESIALDYHDFDNIYEVIEEALKGTS